MTVVAVCERCKREFHTPGGPLGGKFCDVPTCGGYVHWIARTAAMSRERRQ